MGTETLVGLALAAAVAGGTAYNTRQTEKRQDTALADSLRRQGQTQREADARVGEEVAALEQSNADAARRQSLESFMQTLQRGRSNAEAGLSGIGGESFQRDATMARQGVQDYASETANLLSRIDAPNLQRQGEGFGYGGLATDLSLLGRQSAGQNFMDEIRLRAIRRNPWIDAGASVAGGLGSSMASNGVYSSSAVPMAGGGSTAFGYGSYE